MTHTSTTSLTRCSSSTAASTYREGDEAASCRARRGGRCGRRPGGGEQDTTYPLAQQAAGGSPFARSRLFSGITFTGPYARYEDADGWFFSWGADGALYSTFNDGLCGSARAAGGYGWMGTAVIHGSRPTRLVLDCSAMTEDHTGYDSLYSSASLDYRGVWYYGSYLVDAAPAPGAKQCGNLCTEGPLVGFDICYDGGRTWVHSSHTSSSPLFGESTAGGHRVKLSQLRFVDFRRNMRYSPDGYAYLVGHGGGGPTSSDAELGGDNIYMVRVKPTPKTINWRGAYEFYAGRRHGVARWTHSFEDMKPLIHWPKHLGPPSITYDAPLKRYLMWICAPSDGVNNIGPFDTMVLESTRVTGPWALIHYLRHFGPQAYFPDVPSKFIGRRGLTMWLAYSANYYDDVDRRGASNPPGSSYALVLRQLRLDRRH